jgi:hypothetical protein
LDNGEIYSINGVSKFHDYLKIGQVAEFIPAGSDTIYYYDDRFKKLLEIDGKPVTNVYACDTISSTNDMGYIRISLSRWEKGPDGRYSYGDSYDKCLLYNPIIGEFYHDDINGYVFKLWSNALVYKPEAKGLNIRGISEEERKKYLYKLPTAEEMAETQTVRTENYNTIGNILREEIERFLKNIK